MGLQPLVALVGTQPIANVTAAFRERTCRCGRGKRAGEVSGALPVHIAGHSRDVPSVVRRNCDRGASDAPYVADNPAQPSTPRTPAALPALPRPAQRTPSVCRTKVRVSTFTARPGCTAPENGALVTPYRALSGSAAQQPPHPVRTRGKARDSATTGRLTTTDSKKVMTSGLRTPDPAYLQEGGEVNDHVN